jgi:hypothetical protein
MTTASPTQPLTIAAFLFDESHDSVDALAQTLHQQGVLDSLSQGLGQVSQAGREAAESEIATVAHGLLDLDLGDLVVAGWRKHAALTAAVERTSANPGSAEVVELAAHRITSVYQPFVGLLINDVRVATIRFELRTEFLVKALVVTVRNGHLASLRAGTCELTATLAAAGLRLVTRQAHLELPLLIHLPLRIQPGNNPPQPDTAPSRIPSPPWGVRRLFNHPIRRRHPRQQVRQGPPAD